MYKLRILWKTHWLQTCLQTSALSWNKIYLKLIDLGYYMLLLEVMLLLQLSFTSNLPMVREDKSKISFQDGSCGGNLRPLISKILYTFDLQVSLLLQCTCKFQLKSPNGSGADVKNWFSRWWLWSPFWISIQHDFSYFYYTGWPVASS